MTTGAAHEDYVHRRDTEAGIARLVAQVSADGKSRAVLLYGDGGVGKTRLVRALAEARMLGNPENTMWVKPIDVDDSEFWVLSELERAIANDLGAGHFEKYFEYLSRLPQFIQPHIGHETVISHLGRTKDEFVDCYESYVRPDRTVVITLDTVEAIRGMYLLLTLTQWMKVLPRTLFILSGRPPSDLADPIKQRLDDPLQRLETIAIDLTGFNVSEAHEFLDHSVLRPSLSEEEKRQLVSLTAGEPLWLELALDYLEHADPPEEMAHRKSDRLLRMLFRRRLVTPYQSTGFWSEAIRRLAVVRHSVNKDVWRRVMSDRQLPPGISWDQAWDKLMRLPWVRPRANKRFVTLHDGMAEELARRLIPLHDQDGRWRQELWARCAGIYVDLTADPDQQVRAELARLTEQVRTGSHSDDAELIDEMARLEARKRELDQLKTAHLHYVLLHDRERGCDEFVAQFDMAARRHDMLLEELLCAEMTRFLPAAEPATEPIGDVLREEMSRFGAWLRSEAPERYLEVGLRVARFLIQNEQPEAALNLLRQLPEKGAELTLRYRLDNERGNACMRIPARVDEAEQYFLHALAETAERTENEWVRRRAQANKEFGYYYRNLGRWPQADEAYQKALGEISTVLGPGSPDENREELASIQTNWAYLKALQGDYDEARDLVESAIEVRERIGRLRGQGISYSVYGEVLRYDRQFGRAWDAYHRAEEIFEQLKSWPWLGTIYQEQAICLYQAEGENLELNTDQMAQARDLIVQALEICRDHSVRAYPSALNRAGRIFGHTDPDRGLGFLKQSIEEAKRVNDGWFMRANLIEYIDLCYRTWRSTEDQKYRRFIDDEWENIERTVDNSFPDLHGRGLLLRGHLAVWDGEIGQQALDFYDNGFILLAERRIGSHAMSIEFARFRETFGHLPDQVQVDWYRHLKGRWSSLTPGKASTSLLACLESLY